MNMTNLINTSLQRGARMNAEWKNRFNGFARAAETVETSSVRPLPSNPLLKQGVNGNGQFSD
jgi:hypothetical protein